MIGRELSPQQVWEQWWVLLLGSWTPEKLGSERLLQSYWSIEWQRLEKTCDQRCAAMSKAQHNERFPDPSSGHGKKRRDREERQNVALWRQPPITLQYFSLEILIVLKEWTSKWWHHQSIVVSSSLLHAVLMAPPSAGGLCQQYAQPIGKQFISYTYWICLPLLVLEQVCTPSCFTWAHT